MLELLFSPVVLCCVVLCCVVLKLEYLRVKEEATSLAAMEDIYTQGCPALRIPLQPGDILRVTRERIG